MKCVIWLSKHTVDWRKEYIGIRDVHGGAATTAVAARERQLIYFAVAAAVEFLGSFLLFLLKKPTVKIKYIFTWIYFLINLNSKRKHSTENIHIGNITSFWRYRPHQMWLFSYIEVKSKEWYAEVDLCFESV